MENNEIFKYGCFGCSFLVAGIIFAFQDDLLIPKIFARALIASVICFLLGVILEVLNLFDSNKGFTIIIMSMAIIYLSYFKLFLSIFKRLMGRIPIITSSSSVIGEHPIGGIWTKYESSRRITLADFIFSFAQGLIPIFTILGLLICTIV